MKLSQYLDTVAATKKILRNWNDRLFILENTPERIHYINAKLMRTTGNSTAVPVMGGRPSREEVLAEGITKKDLLLEEFQETKQVQAIAAACLSRLTEEQQFILRTMFIDNEDRNGLDRIMDKLFIAKTEAYKRTNEALERLSKLIFW